MRHLLTFIFILTGVSLFGQNKPEYTSFNKLIEVKGSEYVIAYMKNETKMYAATACYLLFINTNNGKTQQIDFPKDSYIRDIEQIKIDSLDINCIVVSGRTVDLDERKGIDWDDPLQVFILSIDGKQKTQLTADGFFVKEWKVNSETGRIAIVGYYDSNNNKKYDKSDKSEILIYDLKSLELIVKI